MKISWLILLMIVLFIVGCTIKTTGNVVIEDIEYVKKAIEEEKTKATETTTTTTIQETEEQPEETTNTTTTTIPEITGEMISIENLKFVPDRLTISKGTTVTWKHNDKYREEIKHRVRIYLVGAASPIMFYGDIFSYTFNKTGEYTFVDVTYIKEDVKGKIIVE